MDAEWLSAANNNAQKVIIDKMNHILNEAPLDRLANLQTYNQPGWPLKQELAQIIGECMSNEATSPSVLWLHC